MTALNGLLRRALRMSAGMTPGQLPHADETADALVVLNAMLSSWNTNRMNIYTISRAIYPLVASQPSYTIGPTGDLDGARPVWIERASIVLGTTSPLEIPLRMIRDEAAWQSVRLKSLESSLPAALYNDGAYPNSTLYLYPICNVANSLVLYTWQALCGFAAMTDTLAFPPGYEDAIAYNLGVRIAAEWGRTLNHEVLRLARESLQAIQSANAPMPIMRCDPAYRGSRNAGGFGPNPLWWMFQG